MIAKVSPIEWRRWTPSRAEVGAGEPLDRRPDRDGAGADHELVVADQLLVTLRVADEQPAAPRRRSGARRCRGAAASRSPRGRQRCGGRGRASRAPRPRCSRGSRRSRSSGRRPRGRRRLRTAGSSSRARSAALMPASLPPMMTQPAHGALRRSAEDVSQRGERLGHDAVVGPAAAALALDEAGVEEHLEVVADGRLAEAERLGEVADAGLAVGLGLDQAQQPQPRGVGDRLQRLRELVGFLLVERPLQERRAGRGGDRRDESSREHIRRNRY